jgi:hypothetical protein
MKAAKLSAVSATFGPLGGDSESSKEVLDSAAVVLREISLDAWNNHQDKATAIEANELALQYASKPELRKQLSDDQLTLRQGSTQRTFSTNERSANHSTRPESNLEILKQNKNFLIVGGIILVVVLANLKSCDSPPLYNSTSTPPASSLPAYSPPVFPDTPNSSSTPIYQVPSSANTELDQDKQAIELEKAKATALEDQLAKAKIAVEAQRADADETQSQLETLGGEIDTDRINLDQTSQSEVDDFNEKVNRYNTMLRTEREQNALANEMVDSYNTLLEQVRAQDRVVNQMVDNYNEKLRQDAR